MGLTQIKIKYRGAEVKPQPSPFPSLMFLRAQEANYAPRMGGRIPPTPPLDAREANYAPRMGGAHCCVYNASTWRIWFMGFGLVKVLVLGTIEPIMTSSLIL